MFDALRSRMSGSMLEDIPVHKARKAVEESMSQVPMDAFLLAALGSIGVSATLQLMGNTKWSQFVGQWAPTFLILGVYTKLVKYLGSD